MPETDEFSSFATRGFTIFQDAITKTLDTKKTLFCRKKGEIQQNWLDQLKNVQLGYGRSEGEEKLRGLSWIETLSSTHWEKLNTCNVTFPAQISWELLDRRFKLKFLNWHRGFNVC